MKNAISVRDRLRRLRHDEDGAAFLEFTAFAGVFFVLLFGIVDFSLAYYQWNAATKAVQVGARLAAVSDPVASELATLTGMEGSAEPGDPMPTFRVVCNGALNDTTGATGSCGTCVGLTSCTYDAAAMRRIVFGRRDSTTCAFQTPAAMCNYFWRITPENVAIEYRYSGLGYAGRPAAESAPGKLSAHVVPTISVSIAAPAKPVPFQFFFLGALLGFGVIDIPGLLSTVTGEDLAG